MSEIRHTIPMNGPFRSYSDIKKYWKNIVRRDISIHEAIFNSYYALANRQRRQKRYVAV